MMRWCGLVVLLLVGSCTVPSNDYYWTNRYYTYRTPSGYVAQPYQQPSYPQYQQQQYPQYPQQQYPQQPYQQPRYQQPQYPQYPQRPYQPVYGQRQQQPVSYRQPQAPQQQAPQPPAITQQRPAATNELDGNAAGLRVFYLKGKTANHEQVREYLESVKIFDSLSGALNRVFRFQQPVAVVWTDCGAVNAYWDGEKRIVMCYELVDYLSALFGKKLKSKDQVKAAVLSAAFFSFLHELGHGAISMFKLPAVGREEDAADQLAALVLIKAGTDGASIAMLGAQFFHLLAQSGEKTPFFDEHSFNDQRFYNILCLVYGSDPLAYQSLVGNNALPAARAKRCPQEYTKLSSAWDALLKDHLQVTATSRAGQPAGGAPAQPASFAGSCETASEHIIVLVTEKLRVDGTPPDTNKLAQLGSDLANECHQRQWPRAGIACAEQAKSLPALEQCNLPK